MKLRVLSKVTAFFLLFSFYSLPADWQWENDLSVATLTPKGYSARLSFHNNGEKEVTVTGLTFSCPCVVYQFSSTTAKSGETGTLTVLIEHTDETPSQQDLNFFAFGSPPTKPRQLTIRIERERK